MGAAPLSGGSRLGVPPTRREEAPLPWEVEMGWAVGTGCSHTVVEWAVVLLIWVRTAAFGHHNRALVAQSETPTSLQFVEMSVEIFGKNYSCTIVVQKIGQVTQQFYFPLGLRITRPEGGGDVSIALSFGVGHVHCCSARYPAGTLRRSAQRQRWC